MKLLPLVALSAAASARAFVTPVPPSDGTSTRLSALTRRKVATVASGFVLGTLASPKRGRASTANPFFEEEVNYEPSQMYTGDRIDVNGAIVKDYMQLPGMYPHAAGKIASHGPYANVKDIYNIPGITDHDKYVFRKYQTELVALPPGRMFKERINQRQST